MPSEVRFAVVRKLLENDGWTFQRVKGSHHQFTKPGHRTYSVPVHQGKVLPFYVQAVEKLVAKKS